VQAGVYCVRIQKLPPEYSKQADKYLNSLEKKTEQRLKEGIEKIRIDMDLTLEIQELSKYLDDNKKRLVLEIIKNFLPELPEDEVMPDDLHYIELAEEEYARGETISHSDRNWQ
jgi:hypothetical protein